ncbi:decarboxylating 6-phosphogluconate dehydrogenase [Candidatus Woesebacteria bacterium]|nr:decarboxylating 6-phosphogluconate dehydrogenase [Candidatus Woesebacteria bacterium]
MKKEIGIIGLGKMGKGIAQKLLEKGWRVIVYNRSPEKVEGLIRAGAVGSFSLKEFVEAFEHRPRIVWMMLTAGAPTEETLFGEGGLSSLLDSQDVIVEGGNAFYKDDLPRAKKLSEKGIDYIDVGVSGGPAGARHGACLMIGGSKERFLEMEALYRDLSIENGYAHFEGVGAGHFVKMVHNGIEYGMMQAIGEGFEVMKRSEYDLDLKEVSRIYNTGSVIESRLIGWLQKAYEEWGVDLEPISGSIQHSGEGKWTVESASELQVDVPVIEKSYEFRVASQVNPSYTGQVVSALRGQFGGHEVKK